MFNYMLIVDILSHKHSKGCDVILPCFQCMIMSFRKQEFEYIFHNQNNISVVESNMF